MVSPGAVSVCAVTDVPQPLLSVDAEPPSAQNGVYIGRVKSYNPKQGYGFLESSEAFSLYGRDVFIHKAQMGELLGRFVGPGTRLEPTALRMRVQFAVDLNKQGMPQARDVQRMEEQGEASADDAPQPETVPELAQQPGQQPQALSVHVPVADVDTAASGSGATSAMAPAALTAGPVDAAEARGTGGDEAAAAAGGLAAHGYKGRGGTIRLVPGAEAAGAPDAAGQAPSAPGGDASPLPGEMQMHDTSPAQASGTPLLGPHGGQSADQGLGWQLHDTLWQGPEPCSGQGCSAGGGQLAGKPGRGAQPPAGGASKGRRRGQQGQKLRQHGAQAAGDAGPGTTSPSAGLHPHVPSMPQLADSPQHAPHSPQHSPLSPQHVAVAFAPSPFAHAGLSGLNSPGAGPLQAPGSPTGHQAAPHAFAFFPQHFAVPYVPDPCGSSPGTIPAQLGSGQFVPFPQFQNGFQPQTAISYGALPAPMPYGGSLLAGFASPGAPPYSPQLVADKGPAHGVLPRLDLPSPRQASNDMAFQEVVTPDSGSDGYRVHARVATPEM